MTVSCDLAFQKVVFAALTTALTGVAVVSHPRVNEPLPYAHIGESEVRDNPIGHELQTFVHVWSNTEGPHEAKEKLQLVREALHSLSFTGDSWNFSCVREEFSDVTFDVTNECWHGLSRYNCVANP